MSKKNTELLEAITGIGIALKNNPECHTQDMMSAIYLLVREYWFTDMHQQYKDLQTEITPTHKG